MVEQVPTFYVREDSTEPFVVQLQKIDSDTKIASAVNLTGYAKVDMRLRSKKTGTAKNFATDDVGPKLSVLAPEMEGKVQFDPVASDWLGSDREYDLHFLVEDGAGGVSSYPSTDDARIIVRKKY